MKIDFENIEDSLFELLDQVKVLISQELWENILLNCTKNEMLVLMLMYRSSEVNMSQIAEYIGVPLNTATGIVTRMEKKHMLARVRSEEDKRVVLISLTEAGQTQINTMMQAAMTYGQKVLTALSVEEITLLGNVFDKVVKVLSEAAVESPVTVAKVRKITID